MLRYLSQGLRPFGDYPMPAHKRLNWEFYAVVRGRLAPSFEESGVAELARDTLWVFPPGCTHGWVGEPGCCCNVVVFHFTAVPAELERRARQKGGLAVGLTHEDKARLLRFARELTAHYWQPNALSELHFERVLMEISLLLLEKPDAVPVGEPAQPTGSPVAPASSARLAHTDPALARVLAAENWFRQHLPARPYLAGVARACGLSPGHLRRHFHAVRRLSPKEVFSRIQMERAMELLAHSDRKLSDVAAECGFAGASQFCQAFKHHHGSTPTFWRKHAYTQYQDPATMPANPREVLVQFGLLAPRRDRADTG